MAFFLSREAANAARALVKTAAEEIVDACRQVEGPCTYQGKDAG